MTHDDYVIRRADTSELSMVVSILDEAAAWLTSQGIEQWPESFSSDSTWRMERIRSYIEHGLTYLVLRRGRPVATFSLTQKADPEFSHGWPDGPDSGGYVFRMAVRRDSAGLDVGGIILDWAEAVVRNWGKSWLRVDVHRSNTELQSYYKRHGFALVAEVQAADVSIPGRIRGSGALMQRPATG